MRTREFRRQKRKIKIRRRQKMAVQIGKHDSPFYVHGGPNYEKLDAAIYGDKPGLFAKHDYGMITGGVPRKTKTKRGQASYRHKGAYGPAMVYTRHDRREMERMKEEDF